MRQTFTDDSILYVRLLQVAPQFSQRTFHLNNNDVPGIEKANVPAASNRQDELPGTMKRMQEEQSQGKRKIAKEIRGTQVQRRGPSNVAKISV